MINRILFFGSYFHQRRQNLPIMILISLGLSQPLGHLTHHNLLETLGRMTGVSPLPLVFDSPDGFEYWSSEYEFTFLEQGRPPEIRKGTSEIFRNLSGPHLLKLAYLIPLAFSPHLPQGFWEPILSYGFCHPHRLGDAFQLIRPVHTLQLTITQGDQKWIRVLTCP